MRKSNWTPSIVPNSDDQTVYLLADDFGKSGRAWRETDCEVADLETIIQGLLSGEYSDPIRVVAFNRPNTAPKTFPKTSPISCGVVAICR